MFAVVAFRSEIAPGEVILMLDASVERYHAGLRCIVCRRRCRVLMLLRVT